MKTRITLYFSLFLTILFTSCEDYLEEVNKTGKTEDIVYTKAEDLEALAATSYAYLRTWYGKEGGVGLGEAGTDLWFEGSDSKQEIMTQYNGLSPDPSQSPDNNACIDQYWEGLYAAINLCNSAIKYIDGTELIPLERQLTLIGEVKFLRAFYYWHMVETWGRVTMNKEPISTSDLNPERNTIDELYEFMFEDVQYGISNLNSEAAPSSRVTYWAAKALKARLALYYASEYGNTAYYDSAAIEATDIINNTAVHGKELTTDFEELWSMEDGYASTSNNIEWLWAVDYFDDPGAATSNNELPIRMLTDDEGDPVDWSSIIVRRQLDDGSGAGNVMHLMFAGIWNAFDDVTDMLNRVTGDAVEWYVDEDGTVVSKIFDVGHFYVPYSMGYNRYAPTYYCLNLFDETADQRFNATFRTAWLKHPEVYPKPDSKYPDCTDTVLFWSKNPLTDAQKTWASTRYITFDIEEQFLDDNLTPNTNREGNYNADRFFPQMRKFENTQSEIEASSKFQDYYTGRDFPIFRIAEMYLIAAEAYVATGDNDKAYDLLKTLAASRSIDQADDGSALLATYGVSSATDVDLDFILEERARELVGEDQRWFDLKRTKKLEDQIMYNPMAKDNFDPEIHYLRPIPRTQMNAIANKTEGPAEGGFWQNPGYK